MGNETRQDTSFFNKDEKNREKNSKNRGGNPKNRKLQEIHEQDFDEVPGNAENGNKISTRYQKMLKTETRFQRDIRKC